MNFRGSGGGGYCYRRRRRCNCTSFASDLKALQRCMIRSWRTHEWVTRKFFTIALFLCNDVMSIFFFCGKSWWQGCPIKIQQVIFLCRDYPYVYRLKTPHWPPVLSSVRPTIRLTRRPHLLIFLASNFGYVEKLLYNFESPHVPWTNVISLDRKYLLLFLIYVFFSPSLTFTSIFPKTQAELRMLKI